MFVLEDCFGPGAQVELDKQRVLSAGAFGALELEVGHCDFVEAHGLIEHALSTEYLEDDAAFAVERPLHELSSGFLLSALLGALAATRRLLLLELGQSDGESGVVVRVAEDAFLAERAVLVGQVLLDELDWLHLLGRFDAQALLLGQDLQLESAVGDVLFRLGLYYQEVLAFFHLEAGVLVGQQDFFAFAGHHSLHFLLAHRPFLGHSHQAIVQAAEQLFLQTNRLDQDSIASVFLLQPHPRQGEVGLRLDWRVLKGERFLGVALELSEVVSDAHEFEGRVAAEPVVVVASAHRVQLEDAVLVLQLDDAAAELGGKGHHAGGGAEAGEVELLQDRVRVEDVPRCLLAGQPKQQPHSFLLLLLHLLHHQDFLSLFVRETARFPGLYGLDALVAEGVGVVKHLDCLEELEEVFLADPLAGIRALQQVEHARNGGEVVEVGEELVLLLVLDD